MKKEDRITMWIVLAVLAAFIIPTAVFGGIAGTIGYHDGYTVRTLSESNQLFDKQPDTDAMKEGDIIINNRKAVVKVPSGATFSAICLLLYGSGNKATCSEVAKKAGLKNPHKIQQGQVLILPRDLLFE